MNHPDTRTHSLSHTPLSIERKKFWVIPDMIKGKSLCKPNVDVQVSSQCDTHNTLKTSNWDSQLWMSTSKGCRRPWLGRESHRVERTSTSGLWWQRPHRTCPHTVWENVLSPEPLSLKEQRIRSSWIQQSHKVGRTMEGDWLITKTTDVHKEIVTLVTNRRDLQSVLYFQSCFVSFWYLWWYVSCWRHGLCRRYDPAQQTTTIRSHTKLEFEFNTRKERDSYLLRTRKSWTWRCLPSTSRCMTSSYSVSVHREPETKNRTWFPCMEQGCGAARKFNGTCRGTCVVP